MDKIKSEINMPKTIEVRNDVFVTGSVACDEKVLREFYRENVENLIKVFDECKKIFKVENTTMLINSIFCEYYL